MAKEIFPSSFKCDCRRELDFFERTVREMEKMSRRKRVHLGDGTKDEHNLLLIRLSVRGGQRLSAASLIAVPWSENRIEQARRHGRAW